MIIKSYKDIPKLKYEALELTEDGQIVDRSIKRKDADGDTYTYNVRGMLPKELSISGKLIGYVAPPVPPQKHVEVKPLDARGKIVPEDIHDEDELDYNDPDYLRRFSEWNQANTEKNDLAMVYQLVCSVEGFDPTDAEIEEATGKKAPANDPAKIEEYKKRLVLIGDMLLGHLPNPHLTQIMRKINQRTGLTDTAINFT